MTNEHPETIFKYRLIEEIARHKDEIRFGEESPWEFSERVVTVWLGHKSVARFIRINDTDEWIEYTYRIERKAKGAYVWEFDRTISRSVEDRSVYHDYPDYMSLDEYLEPELPETEWEEPEYRCCTCNVLVASDVYECAACLAAEEEKYRPRCCACHEPMSDWRVICDDCDRKFGLERLSSVLEFRVLDTYWWRELLDYLKADVFDSILKRVRR